MKRLVVLLVILCLALFFVGSCGKQEEPAKAKKPAASTAPAKEQAAPAKAPEAVPEKPAATTPTPSKEPAAPTPEAKPGAAQPTPVTPAPEKR